MSWGEAGTGPAVCVCACACAREREIHCIRAPQRAYYSILPHTNEKLKLRGREGTCPNKLVGPDWDQLSGFLGQWSQFNEQLLSVCIHHVGQALDQVMG